MTLLMTAVVLSRYILISSVQGMQIDLTYVTSCDSSNGLFFPPNYVQVAQCVLFQSLLNMVVITYFACTLKRCSSPMNATHSIVCVWGGGVHRSSSPISNIIQGVFGESHLPNPTYFQGSSPTSL